MTFDELVAEVIILTNRPELLARTESAVRAATLKMHHTDYYSKDLFETGVAFEDLNFRQHFGYQDLINNFRSFKHLRKASDACDEEGDFFDIITPDEILDEYGKNRSDIAYVAGRTLEIRSSTEFRFAHLACYVHPILLKNDYCSWIAQQYPFAIVYEATRTIFKGIGYDEQAATYTGLTGEEIGLLKLSCIQDTGY